MSKYSDYVTYIEEAIRAQSAPGRGLASLCDPIYYSMTAGGKRLRPVLALMAADAFGGEEGKFTARDAALGLELFHNFTLLHDDVMDGSAMRRGRPSVYGKWGTDAAILSGDTMLTMATECVSHVPGDLLGRVLGIFNYMAIRVYEGQALDMEFETRRDVTLSEYIDMIEGKTGALLAASLKIGALIGGASEEDATRMAEFGMNLGIAFQIQDDWLDVYGDAETFGKPIGGDINNNKQSFLLLTALQSGTPEAEALRAAMAMPAGDAKVRTVTNIYNRLDLSGHVREVIAHYTSAAMAALRATGLPEEARTPFRQLVDKLAGRRK